MRIIFKIIVLLCLIVFSSGCKFSKKEKKSSTSLVKTIVLDNKSRSKISFEELLDTATFIPLETKDESLIASIDYIKVNQDGIYILDKKSSNVLKFTLQGKFEFKLNKGKGPGEIIQPKCIALDESGHFFYVLDRWNIVKKFTKDGDFKREIRLKFNSNSLEYSERDKQFIFYNSFIKNKVLEKGGQNFNFVVTNKNGEIISKQAPYPDCVEVFTFSRYYEVFSKDNGHVYVTIPMQDKIYELINNELVPVFELDYLNNNQSLADNFFKEMAPNKINDFAYLSKKENEHPFYSIQNYTNTERYIFLFCVGKQEPSLWYYDKVNNHSFKVDIAEIRKNMFPCIALTSSKGDFFYSVLYPAGLMVQNHKSCGHKMCSHESCALKISSKNKSINTLLENMDVLDNPVIVKYKLKSLD